MNELKPELALALADAPMTNNEKLVAALRNDMNAAAYPIRDSLTYIMRLQDEGVFTSHLLQADLAEALTALDRPDLIPDGCFTWDDEDTQPLPVESSTQSDDAVDLQALFSRFDVTYELIVTSGFSFTTRFASKLKNHVLFHRVESPSEMTIYFYADNDARKFLGKSSVKPFIDAHNAWIGGDS